MTTCNTKQLESDLETAVRKAITENEICPSCVVFELLMEMCGVIGQLDATSREQLIEMITECIQKFVDAAAFRAAQLRQEMVHH